MRLVQIVCKYYRDVSRATKTGKGRSGKSSVSAYTRSVTILFKDLTTYLNTCHMMKGSTIAELPLFTSSIAVMPDQNTTHSNNNRDVRLFLCKK